MKFVCYRCGKEFSRPPSNNSGIHTFCSMPCYRVWRKTNPNKRNRVHINGKEIYKSRYIMEQILGRTLLHNEQVHHINGIVTDDRPENLKLTSLKEHPKFTIGRKNKPETIKKMSIIKKSWWDKKKKERMNQ